MSVTWSIYFTLNNISFPLFFVIAWSVHQYFYSYNIERMDWLYHMNAISLHCPSSILFFCRLRAARVLLIGMKGLGAEIAKNIVLAGIKSLTLLDSTEVSIYMHKRVVYLYQDFKNICVYGCNSVKVSILSAVTGSTRVSILPLKSSKQNYHWFAFFFIINNKLKYNLDEKIET